jgi:ABC-type dipeptide/oligopeptide/nickel transport system ATPase subunit
VQFFGDEIEKIQSFDVISGNVTSSFDRINIYPANLFVTSKETLNGAIREIQDDLVKQVDFFNSIEKPIEAKRLQERTELDLEMIKELGYCSGIENYSRYMDGRMPGSRPFCLLDYFPKDYLMVIDEISCALESLNQVGMKDYANKKIGDLSGGQRQRVFIARALCSNPKIMLLDEPTASIDVQGQQEIYELLRELNKSICIVVVSHDLSILLNYAKNVAHINRSLVYHSLAEVQKNVTLADDHLCEVELLSALGKTQICCNHVH